MGTVSRPVALSLALTALAIPAIAQQAEPGSTEGRARAILSANCNGCHGQARMSGLSLDSLQGMMAGGKRGPALVPGKASESLLYKAAAREGNLKMPPGNKPLSAANVLVLRHWIDRGTPVAAAKNASDAAC